MSWKTRCSKCLKAFLAFLRRAPILFEWPAENSEVIKQQIQLWMTANQITWESWQPITCQGQEEPNLTAFLRVNKIIRKNDTVIIHGREGVIASARKFSDQVQVAITKKGKNKTDAWFIWNVGMETNNLTVPKRWHSSGYMYVLRTGERLSWNN